MTTSPIPDPYAILGVTPDATDDDLDHAFRSLVRQLHPDTRTPSELDADGDADQRLQELLTAYATLREPLRRAAYDRTRPATTSNAPTPQPRVRHAPRVSAPVRVGPAIRVGPVHWDPPPQATTDRSSQVVGSRRTSGVHDGR
jgi:curved DNA-binding protein CbpA